jgi:hypothetical protein
MKKALLLAVLAWGVGGTAWAECTTPEAKAEAVSKRVQEVAQTDPAKAMPVIQEIQVRVPEFQKNPKGYDVEAICKFYDDMLEKLR